MTTELDIWRQLYLEDLTKMVSYDGGRTKRPRVRNPQMWENVSTMLLESEQETKQYPFDNKTWVWSDLHFFHKNIIDFSDRPYPDVDTMNEHLVANFNDYVGKDDTSIWVGDIGFSNDTAINKLIDQCNGYKILIVGNHDFNKKKLRKLNFDETHLIYQIDTPHVDLVFTHYPMDNLPLPYFNVHGHLHVYPPKNYFSNSLQHLNVNCEFIDYKPMDLDKLILHASVRRDSMEI